VVFLAGDFFAAVFFVAVFLAGDFFAAVFLAGDFFAAVFFVAVLFAAVFFVAVLFAAVFLAAVFLAGAAVAAERAPAFFTYSSMIGNAPRTRRGALFGFMTASLNALAALTRTFFDALNIICSPVAGFRPRRAGRSTFTNFTNPEIAIGSPFAVTPVTTSVNPSSTRVTVLRSTSACTATDFANSRLFMGDILAHLDALWAIRAGEGPATVEPAPRIRRPEGPNGGRPPAMAGSGIGTSLPAVRRRLILLGPALLGAVLLTACGSSPTSGSSGTTTTTRPPSVPAVADATNLNVEPVISAGKPPPPTAIVTKDLVVGTGKPATFSDTVVVQYVGADYANGKVFDSSWQRNQPSTFALNGVVPGFAKGIEGMKVGGRRLIVIPSVYGYGKAGSPPVIAPNETLVFVVDLKAIQ